jgi:hypothetical protein
MHSTNRVQKLLCNFVIKKKCTLPVVFLLPSVMFPADSECICFWAWGFASVRVCVCASVCVLCAVVVQYCLSMRAYVNLLV